METILAAFVTGLFTLAAVHLSHKLNREDKLNHDDGRGVIDSGQQQAIRDSSRLPTEADSKPPPHWLFLLLLFVLFVMGLPFLYAGVKTLTRDILSGLFGTFLGLVSCTPFLLTVFAPWFSNLVSSESHLQSELKGSGSIYIGTDSRGPSSLSQIPPERLSESRHE